jgi:hypothetical protein
MHGCTIALTGTNKKETLKFTPMQNSTMNFYIICSHDNGWVEHCTAAYETGSFGK